MNVLVIYQQDWWHLYCLTLLDTFLVLKIWMLIEGIESEKEERARGGKAGEREGEVCYVMWVTSDQITQNLHHWDDKIKPIICTTL